jgi:serine/threonine protein phosphatase PrpC
MKLECIALTHVGRRSSNQDAFLAATDLGVFAVADGMGGHEGGEVASRLAIEALEALFLGQAQDDDATWPHAAEGAVPGENMVRVATRLAHGRIAARRHGRLAQMGSTLAMALVHGDRLVIGHVGDSRVYRLRGGALAQLTRDHSVYQEMLDQGFDLPAIHDFPYRNMITRALGVQAAPEVDSYTLAEGDVYLLCTDGLSGPVPDARMAEILTGTLGESLIDDRARLDPAAGCDPRLARAGVALMREALERGGTDNITAVLLRCVA